MAIAATAKKRPDTGAARAEISHLTTYTWIALDKRGQKMRGEMPSKNASLVKAELRRQGMNPQTVKERPSRCSAPPAAASSRATSPSSVARSRR